MENLKEIRKMKRLTQKQAADLTGISVRSYKSYENENRKVGTLKYEYLLRKLLEVNPIDENHGVLTIQDITEICRKVLIDYPVHYCILFGSYAKGQAVEQSDIDLLVSSDLKGLQFFGMVEALRENLHKRVDVLGLEQLKNNLELTDEILKDGIRIYD